MLPQVSPTEQAAIDAGDVGFEAKIFQGLPSWQDLEQVPLSAITKEEQMFIDNEVSELCEMLDEYEINQNLGLSDEIIDFIRAKKFFGLVIPKSYDGLEFSAYAHAVIVAKIASRSLTAAVTVMVPNSLGPGELLYHYGTDAQKNKYLSRLATGLEVPCFGLTSTWAGSDAGNMPDIGYVCERSVDGKPTLGVSLTIDKRYITLAPIATLVGVAFKLHDPDKLLPDAAANSTNRGITVALIEANTPNLQIGNQHFPIGSPFPNGTFRGRDIFIPLSSIIGGAKQVGQGWRMLMECLSIGRGISLPSLSVASSQTAYRATGAYASVRRQFNQPIGNFEGIQFLMGHMAAFTYLLKSASHMTVSQVDHGKKPAVASAILKYHTTELARDCIEHAMDIHAGKTVIGGRKNYLAPFYQGFPFAITVEGANILTRNMMIFGQGAIRCHPFVLKELQAIENPNKKLAIKQFDKLIFSHLKHTVTQSWQCFIIGLTRGRAFWLNKPTGLPCSLNSSVKQLTWLSKALAVTSDFSMMLLGGELKRKENTSARLGDVLSYLYLASCVLRRLSANKYDKKEISYAKVAIDFCIQQSYLAFQSFFNQFPNQKVAWLMRLISFPLGMRSVQPSDKLLAELAEEMMQPDGVMRQRLLENSFSSTNSEDELAMMEKVFKQSIEQQQYYQIVQKAVKKGKIPMSFDFIDNITAAMEAGLLTSEQATNLKDYHECLAHVISVDEYAKN